MWFYGLLWGSLVLILPGELPGTSFREEPNKCVTLKSLSAPRQLRDEGMSTSPSTKNITSWGIRLLDQGSLEPQSAELSVAEATHSSHSSHHLRTPSNRGLPCCLGRQLRLLWNTELPLLSRKLINGNLKEATLWIKLSRPKTWFLTSPQLWNPEICLIFIITLFLIIIKSLRSEVSATTGA